jgi:hypothetical protein
MPRLLKRGSSSSQVCQRAHKGWNVGITVTFPLAPFPDSRRPLKQRQQQFLMQAQQDSRSAFVVSAICPIRKNREIALGWVRR